MFQIAIAVETVAVAVGIGAGALSLWIELAWARRVYASVNLWPPSASITAHIIASFLVLHFENLSNYLMLPGCHSY